ncbi:hypothetical protein D3C87_1710380 [compost metagenome]
MAESSRSARSVEFQTATPVGRRNGSSSTLSNIETWPLERSAVSACAVPMTDSTAAKATSRRGARASKAPALTRVSSVRLLSTRGSTRRAKSPRSLNGVSPRTSTICSAMARPTPLTAERP